MARIFSLGICVLLLASLFAWPRPVSAGLAEWSAETIPSRTNNTLGPAGVDIRDLAVANDNLVVYAAPGDSITDNVVYKSTDSGIKWTALPVPIRADYVAIAPDNENLVAIANNITPTVFFSSSAGLAWQTLGTVQETPHGAPAAAIYDLAISLAMVNIHYIAVAGKEAGNIANLWYYDLGAGMSAWHETNTFTGFVAENEVAVFAFSPSFSSDATVVAITDSVSTNVTLQTLKINSKMWNSSAGFTDFPCTIVNNAGLNRLTSASLALSPGYSSDNPETRRVFIGFTVDGDASANATSGIYRLDDTVQKNVLLNAKIHSLAFDGLYLVAGSYDTTTVYRSSNPSAISPTINASTVTKNPGGDNKTVVAWMGNSVAAGTSGDESAFAKSENNGAIFDDISLIDTAISTARDIAVSRDGSKFYLVSENGTDTSVWRYDTIWRRVINQRGVTNYIIRIAPANSSIVYIAERGTKNVYYNSASGTAQWLSHVCNLNVQDMTAEGSKVIYVIDAAGVVTKGTENGLFWNTTAATNLASGATITSVSTNIILAGSQDGFVAYSLNGSISWAKIPQIIEAGAGKVQVAADEDFANNKIIYAASDMSGGSIMKWIIGTSTSWTDIFNGGTGGGIYGLAVTRSVIYALAYDAIFDQSTLWRHLSPATIPAGSPEWTASTITTDSDDGLPVRLNATPQALKISTDKLWAVRTNGTANKLYSYNDVIIDVAIALLLPEQGYHVQISSWTGLAYDVLFNWARPSVATGYELSIALDEDFVIKVATILVNMPNEIAYVIVGPSQIGANKVNFTPGTVYYWRIRATTPGFSPYSATRYINIDPAPIAIIQPTGLSQGGMITDPHPSFSWTPLGEITEYQFMLSKNPAMTSPLMDTLVETTGIKVNVTLEYGETYFWQVRATKPLISDWSGVVTFTLIEKPTDILRIEEAPQETQTLLLTAPTTKWEQSFLEAMFTPAYLPVTVLIMLILLGFVIALVTGHSPIKFFALAPRQAHPSGPSRRIQAPGAEPVRPQARPEPRAETPQAPAAPEKIAPHPSLMEKDKEGAAVIFAAKSFMWMTTQPEAPNGTPTRLDEKERQSLGKKLATKIHDLTKKENIYIKYPEDTSMLLSIWAQYGSRNETSNYLIKSFEASPDNAIRLLKCYLPAAQPDKEPPSADDFTIAQYNSLSEVIDPDKIYAALTKVFKFTADNIEEKMPIKPADRNLAFQFIRLHINAKGEG